MALADAEWTRVSANSFVLDFIRAERNTGLAQVLAAVPNLVSDQELTALLDQADLDNAIHNQKRLRLLYVMRCRYLGEIPIDH